MPPEWFPQEHPEQSEQPEVTALESVATSKPLKTWEEPQALHPAIRDVWRISAILTGVVLVVVSAVVEFFVRRGLEHPVLIPIFGPLLFLTIAVLSYWASIRQYDFWTYRLTPEMLELRQGLVWRQRRCVARDRIQHVDINSGPLDRRFGLVQVVVYAAGAMGSVGSIPGLTPERAEELKEALFAGRAIDA
jgi:membrane protein YdbS with pleckstrin-like domain